MDAVTYFISDMDSSGYSTSYVRNQQHLSLQTKLKNLYIMCSVHTAAWPCLNFSPRSCALVLRGAPEQGGFTKRHMSQHSHSHAWRRTPAHSHTWHRTATIYDRMAPHSHTWHRTATIYDRMAPHSHTWHCTSTQDWKKLDF